MSKIEWTGITWGPVTGCDEVSSGCAHCYAKRLAERLRAMGLEKYRNGFDITMHPAELERPRRWRKPHTVFVCSMADLFHDDVTDEFIGQVLEVCKSLPQHTFQILTKRSERMRELVSNEHRDLERLPHIWLGVSVENKRHGVSRIAHLRRTAAAVRFLSIEPLLEDVGRLNLSKIDWMIVGGESGPKARYMDPRWVRSLRDQCSAAEVPFFFKQWGGTNKKKAGRVLDGKVYDGMPLVGAK